MQGLQYLDRVEGIGVDGAIGVVGVGGGSGLRVLSVVGVVGRSGLRVLSVVGVVGRNGLRILSVVSVVGRNGLRYSVPGAAMFVHRWLQGASAGSSPPACRLIVIRQGLALPAP